MTDARVGGKVMCTTHYNGGFHKEDCIRDLKIAGKTMLKGEVDINERCTHNSYGTSV